MSVEERDSQTAENSERWSSISRRTLLRAGWTAPVILTVAPAVAFAASGTTPPSHTTVTPAPGAPNPSGGKNPGGHNNHATQTGNPTGNPSSGSGGSGGLPEQPSSGPQPARIKRGFTG